MVGLACFSEQCAFQTCEAGRCYAVFSLSGRAAARRTALHMQPACRLAAWGEEWMVGICSTRTTAECGNEGTGPLGGAGRCVLFGAPLPPRDRAAFVAAGRGLPRVRAS
jgi:hypothetical protein